MMTNEDEERPISDDELEDDQKPAISTAQKAKLDELAELERQYTDYKKQFEEWKNQNSKLAGTPAYEQYVSQFDDWEADVDKRRKNLQQAAIRADRKEKEAQEQAAARRANEQREREQHQQRRQQQQQQPPQQQQTTYNYRYTDLTTGQRLEAVSPEPLSDEEDESPPATPPPVNTTQVFDRPAQKKIRISRFSAATISTVRSAPPEPKQPQHVGQSEWAPHHQQQQPPSLAAQQQMQQQQQQPPPMQHQSTAQFAAQQAAQQKAMQAQQQYQNDQYQASLRAQQVAAQVQQTQHMQQQQQPTQQQQQYPQQKVLVAGSLPAQPPLADDLRDIEMLEPYTFMTGMLHLMSSQPVTAVAIMLASQHTKSEADEQKPVQGPNALVSSHAARQAIVEDNATASSSNQQFGLHAPYDASDPIYRRWGARAAPPGHKAPFEQISKLQPNLTQPPPGFGNGPQQQTQQAGGTTGLVNGGSAPSMQPAVNSQGPPPQQQQQSQRNLPFTGPPPGAPIPPGWTTGPPIRFDARQPPPNREYRNPKMPFRDFSVKT